MDVVVLASGRGSNLEALLGAIAQGRCAARVVAVVSDKPAAKALDLARERGIATAVAPLRKGDDREAWNRILAERVAQYEPSLVVLAGFMRVLGAPFVSRFEGRIINVHPALLPSFPGVDGPALALAAGVRISGCTVHVVDAGVDTGPILAQAAVPVHPDDDRDSLHARIQAQEHQLLPRVVDWIAQGAQHRAAFVTSSYYDVILLGTQLPALLAGAVLAKRGFRVLLLGQGALGPTYEAAGEVFPRAPFTFLPAHTPVVRRTLAELALYQVVRRRMTADEPAPQIAFPRHRLELCSDPRALEREIDREFPEVRRPVDDLHRHVRRTMEALDQLTERELVWPSETFFERREFTRAMDASPFIHGGDAWDPFSELGEDHPFRDVVRTPLRFATHLDPSQLGGIATARLYGSWLAKPPKLEGGYAFLRDTLAERIRTYSGEIRHRERAAAITMRRGAAAGVRLAGTGEEIGCSFVIHAGPMDQLLGLVPDRSPFEEIFERFGEPQPRYFRFTMNVVVRAEGVPEGMGREVFFLRSRRSAERPEDTLRVECHPADAANRRLLCVETLLPRRLIEDVPGYIEGVRGRALDTLRELSPFLDRHLLWVDSPHDGRDIDDIAGGREIAPEEPWNRGPSTMEVIYGYSVRGALGVSAIPIRTPIRRLLLCNDQVVPGLGLEGSFLTAWSTARIVTKADRKKEWMRRGLWTKVEL